MEYGREELKNKIDSYFSGAISKEDLGKWAAEGYYDLITGGYAKMCSLEVYPLIKAISRVHVEANEITDEYPTTLAEIRGIHSVLSGEKDYVFQVKAALPDCLYAKFLKQGDVRDVDWKRFLDLYNMVTKSDFYAKENKTAVQQILQDISKCEYEKHTLHGELKEKIRRISESILIENFKEETMINGLGLYVQKGCELPDLWGNLINYLECYLGKRNFYVSVCYKNGSANTSIIV